MRPSQRSLPWILALVTLTGVAPARAELPAATCLAGWWTDDARVPLAVTEAPTAPWIVLPIQWVSGYQTAPEDLAPPTLTVTVTDGAGAVVPGTVALRPESAKPDVAALRRAPRWRPDAPLTAGATYTMHVAVPEPPGDGAHSGCPYGGVDRTLTVTVAPTPTTHPAEVHVHTSDRIAPLEYETCANLPGGVPCADHPNVCCQRAGRMAVVSVAFDAPLPNDGRYDAVELTVTAPGGVYLTRVAYPANAGPWYFLVDHPDGTPPAPAAVCVTAIAYDLFSDAAVVTDTACAGTANHEPGEGADLVCDPVTCAASDPGPGPEPPVEPGPEATAETDPYDDLGQDYLADVLGGDVLGGDGLGSDGAGGSDLVANGAPEASGCAGGGTSPGLVFALAALLGLALIRPRRRRSPGGALRTSARPPGSPPAA
ncbi:MAG: hypothetical protein CVU56_24480 [Deltaproteobacteria bacterium HGW-Deltaproteobacteria-14]|jgi:MYXO-CTERM domain-containing protein|nr:MAG: hypothetical protein CVU56_24480 [Deltaproteobacteria bacterium HGW-Deltaproteobacteria-14]